MRVAPFFFGSADTAFLGATFPFGPELAAPLAAVFAVAALAFVFVPRFPAEVPPVAEENARLTSIEGRVDLDAACTVFWHKKMVRRR